MKRPRTWIVTWRDAYALSETWISAGHEYGPPVIVTTVGYVIDGPAGYLTIADSTYVTGDGNERWFGGITVIPDGMVISRRRR